MTKFLYWSDLHLEFDRHEKFELPELDEVIHGVLLGGDTHVGPSHLNFLERVWDKYQVPVVSIRGNHEYYNQIWQDLIAEDEERLQEFKRLGKEIHVLDPGMIVINGVRIVAATLWTDLMVNGNPLMNAIAVQKGLNDYRICKIRDDDKVRRLTPSDTQKKHFEDRNFIRETISKDFDGPTLVMTHHMPTQLLIDEKYTGSEFNAGFASDMTDMLFSSNVDVWTYGHTHDKNDITLDREDRGVIKLVSNIRGYPHEYGTREKFVSNFTIEL